MNDRDQTSNDNKLSRRTWFPLAVGIGFLVFCIAACGDSPTEATVGTIRVLELEVSTGDGPFGTAEIEIHMFEDSTNAFLGCVRVTSVREDTLYTPNLPFHWENGEDLLLDEIENLSVSDIRR